MIKKVFLGAALFNFTGVLFLSLFFTNTVIGKYYPEVMGNFGLLGILLWGTAYLAAANSIKVNRWPALVFAVEKMVYAATWVWFLNAKGSLLPQIFSESRLAALFLGAYGPGDFLFGLFFLWVWWKGYKSA